MEFIIGIGKVILHCIIISLSLALLFAPTFIFELRTGEIILERPNLPNLIINFGKIVFIQIDQFNRDLVIKTKKYGVKFTIYITRHGDVLIYLKDEKILGIPRDYIQPTEKIFNENDLFPNLNKKNLLDELVKYYKYTFYYKCPKLNDYEAP